MILDRIKTALKKRKVKVFLVFLFFSFLAWFVNNLAQTFVGTTYFHLNYVNVPRDFLLEKTQKNQLQVSLRAVGFQFIGFGIRKKNIQINLAEVRKRNGRYFIPPSVYKKQVQAQLSSDMELLEMDNDTIFVEFTPLQSKEVPVIPRLNITLAKNHALMDSLVIEPKMILIKGPKNQIDTVQSVHTSYVELLNLDADFSQKLTLVKSRELVETNFEPFQVTITGKVYRFSEQVFDVPVTIFNLPDSVKVRMFPDVVQVVCQAKLDILKDISPDDFMVVADYGQVGERNQNVLSLILKEKPEKINNAILKTKEVEFILKRE
ncbi:YbbR-like domain-containing protein [Maribacter algicola]|uniref:YbbR-like domain-containing protein n=1 Tax=Maribacter algicola TaxID=2498892 RepID=A0A426RHQ1_9FLAO|nr:YbbR-like domain-containing protein [Maribacter algicola]RRQ48488.1 YbbR-like domain-containing protein [Maribacter algicola]